MVETAVLVVLTICQQCGLSYDAGERRGGPPWKTCSRQVIWFLAGGDIVEEDMGVALLLLRAYCYTQAARGLLKHRTRHCRRTRSSIRKQLK